MRPNRAAGTWGKATQGVISRHKTTGVTTEQPKWQCECHVTVQTPTGDIKTSVSMSARLFITLPDAAAISSESMYFCRTHQICYGLSMTCIGTSTNWTVAARALQHFHYLTGGRTAARYHWRSWGHCLYAISKSLGSLVVSGYRQCSVFWSLTDRWDHVAPPSCDILTMSQRNLGRFEPNVCRFHSYP
jgi:hypothetical protein